MKTRCPCCGAENSLHAIVSNEAANAALRELTRIGDEITRLAVMYVGMFRPAKSSLRFDRVASLLEELRIDMDNGFIERNGQRYEASRGAWCHAFRVVLEKRGTGLKLPLTSHGYLYEVLASYQAPVAPSAPKEALSVSGKSSQTMAGVQRSAGRRPTYWERKTPMPAIWTTFAATGVHMNAEKRSCALSTCARIA